MTNFSLLISALLVMPTAAFAQDAMPAANVSAPALCTDRPTKATAACTVPKGMIQFESDIVNWSRDSDGGLRTDTILYTSPLVKYGLTDSTDIEASITPYETITTRETHGVSRIGGVGDLYLRVKQRLTPTDAKAQFALEPYIKVPTAKLGIGNRRVEGGLIATGVFSVPDDFSLTVTPEVDDLENDALDGHHAQFVGALNLSKTLSQKLTASAELWTAQNHEPAGHVTQYSVDFALAYLVGPTLQLDAGTNIGLNRSTPDIQTYAGISTRF